MMKNFLLAAVVLVSTPAWATFPPPPTPAEENMCKVMIYSRLDRSDPNSGNMHNYCYGMRALNRAYAAIGNKVQMRYYAGVAIDEFDYVLKHTQESYAMRGEVHVNRARALKQLGRTPEATAEFNKALRYQINNPDVFQELADHFNETGNKQKALEITTEGLKRYPNLKGLKRRYTEFGGKLPYPEAAVEKASPAEDTKPETRPDAKPEVQTSPEMSTVESSDIKQTTTPTVSTPQIEPAKIGTPQNPYCRFCPD